MQATLRSPLFLLLVVASVLLEWFWRSRVARRGYDGAGAWTSLVVGFGHVASVAVGAAALGGLFLAAARVAPLHFPLGDARAWIACFFVVEFFYYWQHRASHAVRWMWATHAVHHSAEQLTLLSAIRLGWTGAFSLEWLFYVVPVLIGFDPRMVFVLLTLGLRYQFFLHTEAVGMLGPLEWIFNTPAHHRVHHACNAEYLDCNFGGVLIVFDRLFGTLRTQAAGTALRYGLAHPLPSQRPLTIAFGEWRRLFRDLRATANLRGALQTAFGRP